MLRYLMPSASVSLLTLGICSTTFAIESPEPLKFEKAPPTDLRILSEKASQEPFGQPNHLPVYAGLPKSTPTRKQPAPRTMPPEEHTLDHAEKVNPRQLPALKLQTRAPVTRTKIKISEQIVVRGLSHPWSLAFMPDGRIIITEKSGTLRVVTQRGVVSPAIRGVPPVLYMGDAGLLDVVLDPAFQKNRKIYLSFIGFRPTGNALMVISARLAPDEKSLEDVNQLLTMPAYHDSNHYGGGLAIGNDGKLYIGTSERITDDTMIAAQSPASPMGKILRINLDGSIPEDNPYAKAIGTEPRIWSIGHRDPEGLAIQPGTGQLWISDHGPQGGDEIDLIKPGHNYGWPIVAYGTHYSGRKINGDRTTFPGTDQPVYYWDPAIAPAGITFYSGKLIPEWQGNLFISALGGRHLSRLVIKNDQVTGEERFLLKNNQRVRDVKQGPDGALWALTDDADGRLIRLAPVE